MRRVARRLVRRYEALGLETETNLPPVDDKGAYIHALCPVPDHGTGGEGDREEYSFTIRQGEDGRALINCFAGCSKERVLEELGLSWRDLFSRNGTEPDRGDRPPLSVRPLSEIDKAPDIPPGPVPKISADGRVVMVAGRDKGGKSTLVGAGISAVSMGGRFLGEDAQQGLTLYVKPPGEGHPSDFRRIIEQFDGDLDQVLVMDRIMWPDDPVAELEEAVRVYEPNLLVIDTLASTFSSLDLDPGRSSDWAPILNRLTDLAQTHDLAIILIHHARKSDGEYRDSTQIGANVDMILELHPVKGDDFARQVRARGRWPLQTFTVRLTFSEDGRYCYELVEDDDQGASLDRRIITFVRANPGCSSEDVRKGVTGRGKDITNTLQSLEKLGVLDPGGGAGPGNSWHYVGQPPLKGDDDEDPFASTPKTSGGP